MIRGGHLAAVALIAVLVSGCGLKGDLYLEEAPPEAVNSGAGDLSGPATDAAAEAPPAELPDPARDTAPETIPGS